MATENYLVSVIVPCFNAEKYLRECLDSILSQSISQFEIIAVDDGSTDKSLEILATYGNKIRVEVGLHQGASAARNRGTQVAQGKYLQYLDADDLLLPTSLEKKIDLLESTGCDVAYADWQKLEEDGTGMFAKGEIFSRSIESIHSDPAVAIFTKFWSPPAALLYRRSLTKKIKWNESLPVIQDARFMLDAALAGAKFTRVSSVEALYRVHQGDSLSGQDPVAFVRDCFRNAQQVEDRWRNKGPLSRDWTDAMIQVYAYVARASYRQESKIFASAYEALLRLEPNYIPRSPYHLRVISQMLGYKSAECIAYYYRGATGVVRNLKNLWA